MRILCAGGGTLGSTTPLLAIIEEIQSRMRRDGEGVLHAHWIGTRNGVERTIVQMYAIPFTPIYCGKLRQYFDLRNFIDPFLLCIGIIQSCAAIARFQPDIIIGAGSYVSVPAIWAGWLLRKRIVLLQLDLIPSLSNLLTAFAASAVLVACEEERRFFHNRLTHVIGIPVRHALDEYKEKFTQAHEREKMRTHFGICDDLPILLIMGGGTGAVFLNKLIIDCLPELCRLCHIIHVTGIDKNGSGSYCGERYHPFEFLTNDLIPALALAEVVITRAGMGSLAELSFLQKACIVIPIPDSHQERNALYIEKKQAGMYCSQKTITPKLLIGKICRLFSDPALRENYAASIGSAFPSHARQRAVDIILSL